VVTEDGTVRRYFGLYGDFTSFSLGNVSAIQIEFGFQFYGLTSTGS
jgi:hypothetical protein